MGKGIATWLAVALTLGAAACSSAPADASDETAHCLTVDELSASPESYSGKRVTVCGWARPGVSQTLVYCDPPACGCNWIDSARLVLSATQGQGQGASLEISLSATGIDCVATIHPFDPYAAPAFELVGTFDDSGGLSLESLDLDASRELPDWNGTAHPTVERPLHLGFFRCTCPPDNDVAFCAPEEVACTPCDGPLCP